MESVFQIKSSLPHNFRYIGTALVLDGVARLLVVQVGRESRACASSLTDAPGGIPQVGPCPPLAHPLLDGMAGGLALPMPPADTRHHTVAVYCVCVRVPRAAPLPFGGRIKA